MVDAAASCPDIPRVVTVEARVRPAQAGSAPSLTLEAPRALATGTSERAVEIREKEAVGPRAEEEETRDKYINTLHVREASGLRWPPVGGSAHVMKYTG